MKLKNEGRGYDPAYRNEPPAKPKGGPMGHDMSFGQQISSADGRETERDVIAISVG